MNVLGGLWAWLRILPQRRKWGRTKPEISSFMSNSITQGHVYEPWSCGRNIDSVWAGPVHLGLTDFLPFLIQLNASLKVLIIYFKEWKGKNKNLVLFRNKHVERFFLRRDIHLPRARGLPLFLRVWFSQIFSFWSMFSLKLICPQ